ncbi:MAG: gas vesicle protein GvpJ [Verrucomicrobiota bacterium]
MRDFPPQRTRHISLCEALDRVLNTGVVALGDVTLSVADVDLIYLGLQLVVTSIESGRELAPATAGPQLGPDSRGGPRLMPREERPAIPVVERPPGSSVSGATGEETELIADAIASADSDRKKNGLGQLVLTLMKLLHELLKRQALRRIEGGALTAAQIERMGVTLMNQAREIERLRKDFGLPEEDLNLDLGPLGKLL